MEDEKTHGFADFPKNFVLNPNYGGGIFRRNIRLRCAAGEVLGELEDCNHGFRVTVKHNDGVVTDIIPQFPRVPFTSCDGAQEPLNVLLGCRIDLSSFELNMLANPMGNCTHLLDLTVLCITNAQRDNETVLYEVEVTDQDEGGTSKLQVRRNGAVIHQWQAKAAEIILPESIQGNTLFRGFAKWANDHFEGMENEAAFVLQKGNLVSLGRFVDVNAMVGSKASQETMQAACYTYSAERAEEAIRLADTVRDFTDTPEQLLKFV